MADRSFAPTVLVGLAGAALAAVAAAQDWATASGTAAGSDVTASAQGSASAPLALALALVALAAWGVVLVLRGRVRRVVAVVGAAAAAGVLVSAVAAHSRVQDDAVSAVVGRGADGGTSTSALTGWYVAAVLGALLALLGFAVAVRKSPGWPAMGSRYDAPAARPQTEQDMWKALDDGHDPTA
jgi:uncharacterized membrane protein (TIGR02234 family)